MANMFMVGAAVGGVVGGVVSDSCQRCSPNHGRIFLVQAADLVHPLYPLRPLLIRYIRYILQAADLVRLPLVVWILRPAPGGTGGGEAAGAAEGGGLYYACLLLLLGFFAPWVGVANKAIFAEATPASARASAVSANAAVEGVFAAVFGAPLVGYIAQHHYGYTTPTAGLSVAQMEPALRKANELALGASLFAMSIWPWLACLLLYTLVHCTFAHDRRVALVADRDEAPRTCSP